MNVSVNVSCMAVYFANGGREAELSRWAAWTDSRVAERDRAGSAGVAALFLGASSRRSDRGLAGSLSLGLRQGPRCRQQPDSWPESCWAGHVQAVAAAIQVRNGSEGRRETVARRGVDLEQGRLNQARALFDAALATGARDEATRHFAAGESLLRALGDKVELGKRFGRRAGALAAVDPEVARADLTAAEALAAETGVGPATELGKLLAKLRAQLGQA